MNWKSIMRWHLIATALYILLVFVSEQLWPVLASHRGFSIEVGCMFLAVCLIISLVSWRLMSHKNPNYFSWVTMLSVLVKLVCGIGLVVQYTWYDDPVDQSYAISFILSYIIFTICEVYVLQQIIYKAKRSWNN